MEADIDLSTAREIQKLKGGPDGNHMASVDRLKQHCQHYKTSPPHQHIIERTTKHTFKNSNLRFKKLVINSD